MKHSSIVLLVTLPLLFGCGGQCRGDRPLLSAVHELTRFQRHPSAGCDDGQSLLDDVLRAAKTSSRDRESTAEVIVQSHED